MNKQNVEIYDYFYKRLLNFSEKWEAERGIKFDKVKNNISDKEKSEAIDKIFNNMDFEMINSIRTYMHNKRFMNKSVWKNIDKKMILKKLETATKHMYYPQNISIAIPWFYKIPSNFYEIAPFISKIRRTAEILPEDFGNKKYIVTALNKSGIKYRYQLKKHLDLGWSFLWTLPGIGDGAKQEILKAIDHYYLNF